jgi:hypothetical protein
VLWTIAPGSFLPGYGVVEAVELRPLGPTTEVRVSCWLQRAAASDHGETHEAVDRIAGRVMGSDDGADAPKDEPDD